MNCDSQFAHTYVGTPFYMSPENIQGRPYNEKSDIWSLGCLIYEMAALAPPFEAPNQMKLAEKIQQGRFVDLPSPYSSDLNRIVKAMIQLDPARRPSCENLLTYPQIANRLREKRIKEQLEALKKKELELKTKEEQLLAREQALCEREKRIAAKENSNINLTF